MSNITFGEILKEAREEGMTVPAVKLAILGQSRPKTPNPAKVALAARRETIERLHFWSTKKARALHYTEVHASERSRITPMEGLTRRETALYVDVVGSGGVVESDVEIPSGYVLTTSTGKTVATTDTGSCGAIAAALARLHAAKESGGSQDIRDARRAIAAARIKAEQEIAKAA